MLVTLPDEVLDGSDEADHAANDGAREESADGNTGDRAVGEALLPSDDRAASREAAVVARKLRRALALGGDRVADTVGTAVGSRAVVGARGERAVHTEAAAVASADALVASSETVAGVRAARGAGAGARLDIARDCQSVSLTLGSGLTIDAVTVDEGRPVANNGVLDGDLLDVVDRVEGGEAVGEEGAAVGVHDQEIEIVGERVPGNGAACEIGPSHRELEGLGAVDDVKAELDSVALLNVEVGVLEQRSGLETGNAAEPESVVELHAAEAVRGVRHLVVCAEELVRSGRIAVETNARVDENSLDQCTAGRRDAVSLHWRARAAVASTEVLTRENSGTAHEGSGERSSLYRRNAAGGRVGGVDAHARGDHVGLEATVGAWTLPQGYEGFACDLSEHVCERTLDENGARMFLPNCELSAAVALASSASPESAA